MATKSIKVARSLTPDQPDGHLQTEAWADAASVLLSIKAKAAYDISSCSAFQGHEEVLFKAGTPFVVCGVCQSGAVAADTTFHGPDLTCSADQAKPDSALRGMFDFSASF